MYLFDNELFAIECVAKYAMEGLDVKKGGVHDGHPDEFAHCPYPRPKGQKRRLPGDLGYWLTFYDHQHQGLLQSVDEGRMCYFIPKVKLYLDTWPPGCFELWDIYDKFNKPTEETKKKLSKSKTGEKNHLFGVPRTEEWKEVQSKKVSGALHPMSRAIIVIKPDGTELHFGGVNEAARELKIPTASLNGYLKFGQVLGRSKFKNWQFFYEVKE